MPAFFCPEHLESAHDGYLFNGSPQHIQQTSLPMKVLHSTALIAVTIAVMMVFGLLAYVCVWLAAIGLFSYSRLPRRSVVFSDWSLARFLVTVGVGLGIGFVYLALTAGF